MLITGCDTKGEKMKIVEDGVRSFIPTRVDSVQEFSFWNNIARENVSKVSIDWLEIV